MSRFFILIFFFTGNAIKKQKKIKFYVWSGFAIGGARYNRARCARNIMNFFYRKDLKFLDANAKKFYLTISYHNTDAGYKITNLLFSENTESKELKFSEYKFEEQFITVNTTQSMLEFTTVHGESKYYNYAENEDLQSIPLHFQTVHSDRVRSLKIFNYFIIGPTFELALHVKNFYFGVKFKALYGHCINTTNINKEHFISAFCTSHFGGIIHTKKLDIIISAGFANTNIGGIYYFKYEQTKLAIAIFELGIALQSKNGKWKIDFIASQYNCNVPQWWVTVGMSFNVYQS